MAYRLALYKFTVALFADEFTIFINQLASAVSSNRIALKLYAFPNGVVIVHQLREPAYLFEEHSRRA